MRIYVASSWRNSYQQQVVKALREAGHQVYDFRNPAPGNHGFAWSEIDPDWLKWDPPTFLRALRHPIAKEGFNADMVALYEAEAVVLVLPCGRSAHLEFGYGCGANKGSFIYMPELPEPELMYRMAGTITTDLDRLVEAVDEYDRRVIRAGEFA